MKISEYAEAVMKEHEGLRLKAYRCPAGVLTIGYGHTLNVKPDDVITLQANCYLPKSNMCLKTVKYHFHSFFPVTFFDPIS